MQVTRNGNRTSASATQTSFQDISDVEEFLDFIASLRLQYMPHRGSQWDRVLQRAEFFSTSVHHFRKALKDFVPSSDEAAHLVWGNCVAEYYSRGGTSNSVAEFDATFGRAATVFFEHRDSLANAFWTTQLGKESSMIEDIRQFLSPNDTIAKELVSNRLGTCSRHEEFTCEWFDTPLKDFFRFGQENVFLITGKSGCGKSVLAEWIVERLRRRQGRLRCDVISYFIEPDIKSQTSPLSIVKGLLLQLFDRSVGNIEMAERITSLLKEQVWNEDKMEQALWDVLEIGLKDKQFMIVIDGLDQLDGGDDACTRFIGRLHQMTSKCPTGKAIVLSRPLRKSGTGHIRLYNIEVKHVTEDITRVVRSLVASSLPAISMDQKSTIVQRLVSCADGSFTQAVLILEILKQEKTFDGITRTLDKAPKTLLETVQKLLSFLKLDHKETRSAISWLLAAHRPLTVEEIRCLMSIDTANMTSTPRLTDAENDVRSALGPFVRTQNGVVRFSHLPIRHQLLELAAGVKESGKADARFPFSLQEAHCDLVLKCLAYANISFTESLSPTMEALPHGHMKRLFERYPLLEYTVRYWAIDFLNSPMCQKNGQPNITNELKKVFPTCTALAVLEFSCWSPQTMATDTIKLQEMAMNLRQAITGDHSETTFQSLIAISRTYQQLSRTPEAQASYARTFKIGLPLLGQLNGVLAAIVAEYVQSTERVAPQKDQKSMEVWEEMLQYLISYLKHTRGASDSLTIKYTGELAALYRQTNKIDRAGELQRERYNMCVEHYGHQHPETVNTRRSLTQLLKDTGKTSDLTGYEVSSYESSRNSLPLTDRALIDAALSMVAHYETIQKTGKAEGVLVELWQTIARTAQTNNSPALQERKVQIALEYESFLESHDRTDDAKNVLVGLWSEYERCLNQSSQLDFTEETLMSVLTIGKRLCHLSSLSTAKLIFMTLWTFCKQNNKQNSELARESALWLSKVTKEVSRSFVFDTSTKPGTSAPGEHTGHSTQSGALMTAETLSALYVRQERWSEAVKVTFKVLEVTWPSIVNGDKAVLPLHNRNETIDLAKRLALCYFKQRRIGKAELVLVHVFQSCKTLGPQDGLFLAAMKELEDFYETTYQFEKAIDVLGETYELQKKNLKPRHATTIETAYRVGRLCRELHRIKDAEKYFLEVVTALDSGSNILEWGAVEAALALCSIYKELQQWKAAEHYYTLLWQTFLQKAEVPYRWMPDTVERMFYGYFGLLDNRLQVEHKMLIRISTEYRERCLKLFSGQDEMVAKATIHLAVVYGRSDEHRSQAISTYESAFSNTSKSPSFSKTTIKQITQAKQNLAHLYSTQASTSNKGVTLYAEEYQQIVSREGYASDQAIGQLTKMTSSLSKETNQETIGQVLQLLQASVTKIALTETDRRKLFVSAQAMARLYLQLGKKDTGMWILSEFRRQIITEEYDSKLSIKGAGRHTLVFIVAFEEALRGATTNSLFSELMASLLNEHLLYQSYVQATKNRTSFEVTFSHGSRLCLLYKQAQRTEEFKKVERDLFKQFVSCFQTSESSPMAKEFFGICIDEMGKNDRDFAVVSATSTNVQKYMEASKFKEAYELSVFIDRFLQLYGGYQNRQNIELAFKLCLGLAGRGTRKCQEQKLHQQMLDLSASILQRVLESFRRSDISFSAMSLAELNDLVGLLGEQKAYEALEMILSTLWTSRHSQTVWSSAVMVNIGQRLVEVQFILPGRREHAIHLAEDMTYNLRRVWGAVDATTLEMFELLGSLYTADGNHRAAMGVYERVLREVLDAYEEYGMIDTAEGAQLAVTYLELLKRSFLRLGGWDKDAAQYRNLYGQLRELFQGEQAWSANAVASHGIDWNVKEKGNGLGMWKQPASFEFYTESEKMKHQNHLRRTSGL
ncbi:uncharacterized protein K452DRAFT_246663, partial [Aplosporella prunicola CBS 121167]